MPFSIDTWRRWRFFLNEVVDRHRRVQQEQASSKFVRNTNAVRLSSETCQRTGSEKRQGSVLEVRQGRGNIMTRGPQH